MKILISIGSFLPEISGGATHVATIIDNLQKEFQFKVFCGCSDFSLAGKNSYQETQVYRIADNLGNIFQRILSAFKVIKGYLAFARECDLLHAHGFTQMNMILMLFAKICGKKIILSLHTAGHDDPFSVAGSALGRIKTIFFKLPDRIICVGPGLFELCKRYKLDTKKLVLIPNGIDTEKFQPQGQNKRIFLRKELGLPGMEYKLILFVGYMTREKGLHLLLKAWETIKDRYPRVKIIAICQEKINTFDKNYANKIHSFIAEKGLSDSIISIEKTLEIEKYFAVADLFVLPSYKEGMPNALLEAMSTGLVCISAKLEGSTDYLIQDSINGGLFKKGSSKDLAQKLEEFLKSDIRDRKIGEKARKEAFEKYNIANSLIKYQDIYTSLQ